jgi:hypothetical protein
MRSNPWPLPPRAGLPLFLAFSLACAGPLRADQIVMQNGDHYAGSISSITTNTILLQSDVLGQITLPRDKVAAITLGPPAAPIKPLQLPASTNNPLPGPAAAPLHSSADLSGALRQLGDDTNLVQQIRQHFLAQAGPEANNKFDDLLGGLFSGKMDLNALRAEAKSAADQIRELKKDPASGAGVTLDIYLKVLEDFLAESAPPAAPATNAAPAVKIIR